ncbi:MAG TPA: hypothetical protein DHV36_10805 [Desulfobacteraceae bacterium]|nr:hypothetical protein [Desulfobacteraceae bacterium]
MASRKELALDIIRLTDTEHQLNNRTEKLVLPPTDIPKLGRFCVIRDPQGINLNLITYADTNK